MVCRPQSCDFLRREVGFGIDFDLRRPAANTSFAEFIITISAFLMEPVTAV
jgi:hypothetical protein